MKRRTVRLKLKKQRKKNRNGKAGINKHGNYTPDMYAPRKVCVKCGSSNHLVIHCKSTNSTMPANFMFSNLVAPHTHVPYAYMTYLFNPYFAYANTNMHAIPWNMSFGNHAYASQFLDYNSTNNTYNMGDQNPMIRSQLP